jgi:hypothetical protein
MGDHKFLFEQVLSNWYDREESDQEIVAEMAILGGVSYTSRAVEVIQSFLDDLQPPSVKAAAIRAEVWRVLPEDDAETLEWLIGIKQAIKNVQPPAADS